MDIFHPTAVNGAKQVFNFANDAWDFLRQVEALNLPDPVFDYIQAIQLALAAVVRGNRGIGAVIRHTDEGIIGRGRSTLHDQNDPYWFVGHAEINAIADMNRTFGGGVQSLLSSSELVSSVGPCMMCMGAAINERVPKITTLCADYTGGVSLEYVAKLFPGYARHIEETGIQYQVADFSGTSHEVATMLRRLAWALSRISEFSFNREEFEKGLNGEQASEKNP